jgi:hypothetical protein
MLDGDQQSNPQREASDPQPGRPAVDLDLLTELVYQRWLDEVRRERERGAWAECR